MNSTHWKREMPVYTELVKDCISVGFDAQMCRKNASSGPCQAGCAGQGADSLQGLVGTMLRADRMGSLEDDVAHAACTSIKERSSSWGALGKCECCPSSPPLLSTHCPLLT